MKWSKDKPKEQGWYWYRNPDINIMNCPMMTEITRFHDNIKLLCENFNLWIEDMEGYEWQGPLRPDHD